MNEQSIQEYFMADHNRLDHLFEAHRLNIKSNQLTARNNFNEFRRGLEQHIEWEEKILFPIFEEKTGTYGMGPTTVMRMEHQEIRKQLDSIQDSLSGENVVASEGTELIELLGSHNLKEENILYPAIDSQLTDNERQDIFDRMQKLQLKPV